MHNDEPLTPDEIRTWRANNFGRGFAMMLWAIPLGIGISILRDWLKPISVSWGLPANIVDGVTGPIFVILALQGFIWFRYRKQDSHEILHERLLRQKIDRYQRNRRLWEIAFCLTLLWIGYDLTNHKADIMSQPGSKSLPFSYISVVAVGIAMAWKGSGFLIPAVRKALNDELTKDLRRKSLVAGYLCLLSLLSIAFGIVVFRPDLAPTLMLWLMFAGVTIPVMSFVFLEWKASRS